MSCSTEYRRTASEVKQARRIDLTGQPKRQAADPFPHRDGECQGTVAQFRLMGDLVYKDCHMLKPLDVLLLQICACVQVRVRVRVRVCVHMNMPIFTCVCVHVCKPTSTYLSVPY